jgi:xanthine dehydrogenase/oxidase
VERVDLSAHGFYATPDIGFDWAGGKGTPYHYFTYGDAFAEVEVETLTGDFHTRTVDIVMDLGFSINPTIDIGQVFPQQLEMFSCSNKEVEDQCLLPMS